MTSEVQEQQEGQAAKAVPVEIVKFRFWDETVPAHMRDTQQTVSVTWDGRREDLKQGVWYTLPRGFLENVLDATHPVEAQQFKDEEMEQVAAGLKAGESQDKSRTMVRPRFRVETANPSPVEVQEAMGIQRRGPGRPPKPKPV